MSALAHDSRRDRSPTAADVAEEPAAKKGPIADGAPSRPKILTIGGSNTVRTLGAPPGGATTAPLMMPSVAQPAIPSSLPIPGPQLGALVVAAQTNRVAVASSVDEMRRRQRAEQAKEARRVHIHNIPHNYKAASLRSQMMDHCLTVRRALIKRETGKEVPHDVVMDIDDILEVDINSTRDKWFSFVEFSNDDMAAALVSDEAWRLTFIDETNQVYKVQCGRTKDFRPLDRTDPRKVVMFGLRMAEQAEGALRELFGALGDMEVFAVVPGRGCYVEYRDATSAAAAIAAINGSTELGAVVVVQLATEGTRATLLAQGLPVTGLLDNMDEEVMPLEEQVLGELMNLKVDPAQAVDTFVKAQRHLVGRWPMPTPTRILCLFNMYTREEVDDDAEFEELRTAIEEEVELYGRVRQLIIPRRGPPLPMPPPAEPTLPPQPDPEQVAKCFPVPPDHPEAAVPPEQRDSFKKAVAAWEEECGAAKAEHASAKALHEEERERWHELCSHPVHGDNCGGRVFIEYETIDEAEAAQHSIAGRCFNGRTVVTSFMFPDVLYPEEKPDLMPSDDDAPRPDKGPAPLAITTAADEAEDAPAADGTAAAGPAEDLD